jgi:hypothetical protein
MTDNIRLLEDLVERALARMNRLTQECDRLQEEVGRLRDQLAAAPQEPAGTLGHDQRITVVSGLREALAELRGDRTASPS